MAVKKIAKKIIAKKKRKLDAIAENKRNLSTE